MPQSPREPWQVQVVAEGQAMVLHMANRELLAKILGKPVHSVHFFGDNGTKVLYFKMTILVIHF